MKRYEVREHSEYSSSFKRWVHGVIILDTESGEEIYLEAKGMGEQVRLYKSILENVESVKRVR